jgi:tyrosyl-tRNA synthetase
MYGKVMSISDQMMWRFYELLTDVQVDEIENMKREAHPMQAKKDLARKIVGDFHSAEAATKAEEDWGKQFQKGEVPEEAEQATVNISDVAGVIDGNGSAQIRLDRLLSRCGLADSTTDAARKLKQGSVKIDGQTVTDPRLMLAPNGASGWKLTIRVGKKLKVVTLQP